MDLVNEEVPNLVSSFSRVIEEGEIEGHLHIAMLCFKV